MASPTECSVQLHSVTKRYKGSIAVADMSLEIGAGEFFSILGPSGCGKTTTLRMLGGFLYPEVGNILIDGIDVTTTPPYRRNVNTVFQSYALFEHLSVYDNVAFGLRRRKVARPEIRRRVVESLEMVRLLDFAARKPGALSGGQRQRVALARALVNLPSVLLLDEPLAALDLQLRRQMQGELRRIHREVGVTFVFVTHDQEEAMSMSDRLAVMKDGVLQQVGTPVQIYDRPVNDFVAGFIGASNLIGGRYAHRSFTASDGQRLPCRDADAIQSAPAVLSIRPEHVRIVAPGPGNVTARVRDTAFLGAVIQVSLELADGTRITAAIPRSQVGDEHRIGDEVAVSWSAEDALVLPNAPQRPSVDTDPAPIESAQEPNPSDDFLRVRS